MTEPNAARNAPLEIPENAVEDLGDHPGIRHQAVSFDAGNALFCAQAASLVYKEPDRIKEQLKDWGYHADDPEVFEFFDRSGTQAFVLSDDRFVLISFRGTQSDEFRDWLSDLRFHKVPGPLTGKVHRGFLGALDLVRENIEEVVKSRNPDGRKTLWITGHSLGAALAALSTAYFLQEGVPVAGTYTFGQPRLGSVRFSTRINSLSKPQFFRYANNNDVVPRVPLWMMGFRQFGTLHYFDSGGDLWRSSSFLQRVRDRLRGRIFDFGRLGPDGIKDHSMARYLELTREAAQQAQDG